MTGTTDGPTEGNASFRQRNTAVIALAAVEAPEIVTSASFDEQLADTYSRLGLRRGMLELVAGIRERRWWPDGTTFAHAATLAGRAALDAADIEPERIGLLINSSVCRDHLEPSASVEIHHTLGLPTSCMNFDLANACLGFMNAMQIAGNMIDAGQIEYALVVDGEGSRQTQEATLARLSSPTCTTDDFYHEFATLTLGSGGAAMVLGRADANPGAHRVVGGIARAGTEHYDLCVGDLTGMRTDTKGLLDAGLELAESAWKAALTEHDWTDMDCYVLHQVSNVHTSALLSRLGIDPAKTPLTFPEFGNIGPASLPFTLARQSESSLKPGDRVLCMGIGSGLNTSFCEITW